MDSKHVKSGRMGLGGESRQNEEAANFFETIVKNSGDKRAE